MVQKRVSNPYRCAFLRIQHNKGEWWTVGLYLHSLQENYGTSIWPKGTMLSAYCNSWRSGTLPAWFCVLYHYTTMTLWVTNRSEVGLKYTHHLWQPTLTSALQTLLSWSENVFPQAIRCIQPGPSFRSTTSLICRLGWSAYYFRLVWSVTTYSWCHCLQNESASLWTCFLWLQ